MPSSAICRRLLPILLLLSLIVGPLTTVKSQVSVHIPAFQPSFYHSGRATVYDLQTQLS
jgi:hypothetical protein